MTRDSKAGASTGRASSTGTGVLDVSLFATLVLAVVAAPFAIQLHVLASTYHGTFARVRTISWLALLVASVLSVFAGFAAYVVPWGQMSFWFAAFVGGGWGEWALLAAGSTVEALQRAGSWLFAAILAIDITLMHAARVRRWGPVRTFAFLGAWVGTVLAVFLAVTEPLPRHRNLTGILLTPAAVVPSLAEAPFYAMLRAVPDKTVAAIGMFATMLLPIGWPWVEAWRFHAPATRAPWRLLCLTLAGAWVGLSLLGLQTPRSAVVWLSRGCWASVWAFFLIAPALLSRRCGEARRPNPFP